MTTTLAASRTVAAATARYPARRTAADWPATRKPREELLALSEAATPGPATKRVHQYRRRGLVLLLDWLERFPGESWQLRWLASGADDAGEQWADIPGRWLEQQGMLTGSRLRTLTGSLVILIGADVIRPSLAWLFTGGQTRKLARNMACARDPEGFAQLDRFCRQGPAITEQAREDAAFRIAVIVAAKGGTVSDIVVGDVLESLDVEYAMGKKRRVVSAAFGILRQMGVFGPGVPTLREIRSSGQLSVEELIDRYRISCRPVRDLLVDYLKERQPALDYSSMRGQVYHLVKCFWVDLEKHNPGIDSLRLDQAAAVAWKQRLQTRTKRVPAGDGQTIEVTVERESHQDTLAAVRAFYLDLAQWALEEPGRWGPWVAPSPVNQQDLVRRKTIRQRKARMDARTRERLPILPMLVRSTRQRLEEAEQLLAAGRQAQPGEEFTAAGRTLVRAHKPLAIPGNIWAADPASSRQLLLNREEDRAFWVWTIIEVLRLTGLRIEEMLELTHHSLVQYRLPTTGEIVPLLQVAPSKTDVERLLVVSPELADVLSAVIRRVRDASGAIPLIRARDYHEHLWMEPAPLLFQRLVGAERHRLSRDNVADLLDRALVDTGLVDVDGGPLHYTPHDFRRIFITDAIMNGLPPHIAQVIAGHQDISVTIGYKAVYPEETIKSHLAFLARRRALRPSEEYRTPSEAEWLEFLGHFERRKVATGLCGRAFSTPCIHEHACLRCSMHWPDPDQRFRIMEIRDNLIARIAEAEHEGWLGEVEGLQTSLAGANDKLAQLDRRSGNGSVDLPMPVLRSAQSTLSDTGRPAAGVDR
jgi:integrase